MQRKIPSDRVLVLALGLWAAALGSGFTILLKYKSTPGEIDTQPPLHWPSGSRLQRPEGRAALVMFAHPHCPCTRASISELARLMGSVPAGMRAYVLFLRRPEVSADGDRNLWRRAASIPGVTVLGDDDGVEARRFHALTSGLTLVYGDDGRLLFQGGITASRGHEGDSFGRRRIISLLTTGKADRTDSPVFGCALGPGRGRSAKSLEDES